MLLVRPGDWILAKEGGNFIIAKIQYIDSQHDSQKNLTNYQFWFDVDYTTDEHTLV